MEYAKGEHRSSLKPIINLLIKSEQELEEELADVVIPHCDFDALKPDEKLQINEMLD